MSTTTTLELLLKNLSPELRDEHYVFCSIENAAYGALAHTNPVACFAEQEGLSLVMRQSSADQENLTYQGTFRCISLQVHSSLEAVGLTAAVSHQLAAHGISANVIAAFHHDHIFVPSLQANQALQVLTSLGQEKKQRS